MSGEYSQKMDAAVADIAPLLRERGFRKQRHRFNADAEPGLTQVLTFQMGAHQPPGTVEVPALRENLYGTFTINLGLHFEEIRELPPPQSPGLAFLREQGLAPPRPRPPRRPRFLGEGDCHITVRLGQLIDGCDTWWRLELPQDELDSLVRGLVADHALAFFERLASRDAVLEGWHAGDPALRDTPKFTIAIIHARRGEAAEAEKLLGEELRETDRAPAREAVLDAAERLGLTLRATRRNRCRPPD